jgi:hypothetical protein
MRNLYKANRVVKWHGTNGTFLRRPKSKSESYFGVEETWPPKEEASKVSLRGHAHASSASQRVGW